VRKEADGESLKAAAAGLEPVIVDVTDAAAIEALRAKVEAEHGGRLAGLVNNAGISVAGPLEGVPGDEWRRQFEVNVIGQVAVTTALLPALRAAKGRVAFMSSVGGRNAIGLLGPYGASKHAIEAIGDSLRQEMQPFGVNVAIIEPGSVATPIWEKGLEDAAASRAALGEEVDRLYGERLDAFAALAEKTGAAGVPPEDVAKAVTHALTADRPKTRYVVGRDARAQLAMKAILPDRGLDRLIARMVSGA
jgi:NAD(P)-dependent dehydrogenase (short-subunit alcohol dehydrogenase family)